VTTYLRAAVLTRLTAIPVPGLQPTIVLFEPLQDHKRAFDGDQGSNTGGMGAYAPTPLITPRQTAECLAIMQVCG
jgi:phosphoribosylamine-glycine ligase